jgi:GxxExxY protein
MLEFDPISKSIIGAALEVPRVLGPGFGESVYHRAPARELSLRGISFVS